MESTVYIIVFAVVLVSLVSSVAYVLIKRKKHREEIRPLIDKYAEKDSGVFAYLHNRATHYISNYHIFIALEKISGILSIWLSISGLALSFYLSEQKVLNCTVTLFAIFCVFVALYLSPKRKITDYKEAWIDTRSLIIKYGEGELTICEVNVELERIEKNLKSDED